STRMLCSEMVCSAPPRTLSVSYLTWTTVGSMVSRRVTTPMEVIKARKGMFGVSGTGDTSGFGGLETVATLPGGSDRPYGGYFDEAADILAEVLAEMGIDYDDAVEKVVIYRGEMTIFVAREHLPVVAKALRDDQDLRFELCLGASGVHYPQDEG